MMTKLATIALNLVSLIGTLHAADKSSQQILGGKPAASSSGSSRYYDGHRSFAEADSERMLEIKTTGLGKFFPFLVTSNEVCCSEDIPHQYHLFRVFDFGRTPRLYILHGSLRELCQLDPVLYRAVI